MDWGEQVVLITGGMYQKHIFIGHKNLTLISGASGIGELLANTMAVRNVTVVVLDINPIITENCSYIIYAMLVKADTGIQITSPIINVTYQTGRRLKLFQKKSLKRCILLSLP